jgi:hypothetical protein
MIHRVRADHMASRRGSPHDFRMVADIGANTEECGRRLKLRQRVERFLSPVRNWTIVEGERDTPFGPWAMAM